MPRDNVTASVKTASEAGHVIKLALVYMDFASGDLFVNSSSDAVTWDGDNYLGLGALGSISAIEENGEQKTSGMQFGLSGVPTAYISTALTEHYQGRPVKMWEAFLDTSYALIDDPVLVFSGLMDTMDIKISDNFADITVNAESRLSRWESASNLRFNNATQQKRFSGDLGLEFAESTAGKELVWPKS